MLQLASVFLLHRREKPDSMHVLHAMHGVRPVELQVDPELQLVAAFTMVNPKRPCEEKEGVRKGRQGGMQGACWAVAGGSSMGAHEGRYRPWRLREMHMGIRMRGDAGGDAGELSSADRLLTCLKDRPDAAFP